MVVFCTMGIMVSYLVLVMKNVADVNFYQGKD
jgi:hypothetical protein